MPACPGRARTGGSGLEPVRPRGPGGHGAVVGSWAMRRGARGRPGGGVMTGPGSRRVAAIDCGTNSLRLLIADVDPVSRQLTDVERRMEIVRLGQGVDATGRLAPDALARTFAMLEQYARAIDASRAAAVRLVATSATRDASNAAEFTDGVRQV